MNVSLALDVMREGFVVALKLIMPILLISMTIGLIVAVIQAATQIQEQTLSFAPKLIGIAITLLVLGPWMISTISEYAYFIFDLMLEINV